MSIRSENASHSRVGQESSDSYSSPDQTKPMCLSAAELAILQKLHPGDAKWKGAPLIEANGIKVNSGIVMVNIDGKRCRMNTDAAEFGRILPND